MEQSNEITTRLLEVSGRIRELREISGFSVAEMAGKTGVTEEEYIKCEEGMEDLNFAFLYRCAIALSVDVTDIVEGTSPKLSSYTVTRNGAGQRIERAHGMIYYNLAPFFRSRIAEPLRVTALYDPKAQGKEIECTSHAGQECDIIIKGKLRVQVGEHIEVLSEGDSIYYDSATPHGMMAVDGADCLFYAIVLNPTGEPIPEFAEEPVTLEPEVRKEPEAKVERIYEKYIDVSEDARGALTSISFKDEDGFNFAFDVVDVLAEKQPDKLAMLHVDRSRTERRFSFYEMSRSSSRVANYFKSLGIKRGDRVVLILRRNYQFWFTILALHKLGAIAIPATDQLLEKDLEYRFNAAGVKAVVCTGDGGAAAQVDLAAAKCPEVELKIYVGGQREGWRCFDEEYPMYSGTFRRTPDAPCGEDPMLMFFTSGTTGYPKIAAHNFKYPLGHFITAKYWHCVDPDGLHLTISDTGWAKALWGKLYGQWLCEAAVFVYDFDRFDANDILPMFAQYGITTFCAPPTIYRFMIKENLSKFDLSSVKHATIAGEALNPEVFQQFKKATGISIMEGFGQSETTVLIGNFIGMTPKIGSLGKPTPLYDVQLLSAQGTPVKAGQTGEICIRTEGNIPCGLFRGYYRDEAKTSEAWHDGYYHTGDTAWCDEDGYFWYIGRVDDLIKSSGYRIGPFEIESVLMELPYVLECGVSAAPDEIRGQVVKATIVLTRGREGTDELKKEIQEYVKKRTAPYKYPRIVEFCAELPKTTSGKIQRNKL